MSSDACTSPQRLSCPPVGAMIALLMIPYDSTQSVQKNRCLKQTSGTGRMTYWHAGATGVTEMESDSGREDVYWLADVDNPV